MKSLIPTNTSIFYLLMIINHHVHQLIFRDLAVNAAVLRALKGRIFECLNCHGN
jgi:hypothetical protein